MTMLRRTKELTNFEAAEMCLFKETKEFYSPADNEWDGERTYCIISAGTKDSRKNLSVKHTQSGR